VNTAPVWQQIALADTPPTLWKNGGGTTRELLAWPTPQDWTLRLSVAQVDADGPFSRFDGITRWFAVLAGAGVRLHIADASQTHSLDVSSSPLEFDGAVAVDCTLIDGPTKDFNLMARSARHPQTRMQRVKGQADWQGTTLNLLAVWANTAPATLHPQNHAAIHLKPGTLAWASLDAAQALAVHSDDALLMEVCL
jgi:environmental stress-induced protein Ves